MLTKKLIKLNSRPLKGATLYPTAKASGLCVELIEAFDRGQKFRQYRRIETLREYVLIEPEQISVECYRLNENGRWELYHYASSPDSPDDCQVELTSIELAFPLNLLYEDIDLLDNGSVRSSQESGR